MQGISLLRQISTISLRLVAIIMVWASAGYAADKDPVSHREMWHEQPLVAAESEEAKRDFVRHMAQDAVSILHDYTRPMKERRTVLKNAFATVVDINWIARFVLGRSWHSATDEQKERYTTLYRRYLTQTYISTFDENPNRKITNIKVMYVGDTEDAKFTVRTRMLLSNNSMVQVDYLVRDQNNRYKIMDIVVEGVSLLASHRAEFGDLVASQGLEGLLSTLEKMTDQTEYLLALPS